MAASHVLQEESPRWPQVLTSKIAASPHPKMVAGPDPKMFACPVLKDGRQS